MAKQNKTPEQDSAPAVQSDADIIVEGQQTGQPEAPPFEVDTQPPEMTADPSETVTPSEVTEQFIVEESGAIVD